MASLALYDPSYHVQAWRRAVMNAARAAKRVALAAVLMLEFWAERARTRRALGKLDDRILSDLGLSRAEAVMEAEKPFWKA